MIINMIMLDNDNDVRKLFNNVDSKQEDFDWVEYDLEELGLPNVNQILDGVKKNITQSYIIGKNINFFKKQIEKKISYKITKNLKNSIIQILKDINLSKARNNTILLSPASASFDQFLNFEKRGDEFKKLSKYYARKYI